ncbi:hypothetical protein AAZX31_16G044300 [Glycine max]|uniref:CCHC-type domain-containing protein n=1 Tax=Glycine max TaxID=3847 RepID=I1ML86_SOYBN|nr:uncharacterized protein LOC100804614 [Glycine max]KAG4938266.1 hypothetical protein JHK86_044407 [Glycine max]KAH1149991.1 hypothetical protein GYH30_044153 [Glycine max]KRH06800.1 hypothetical protein GLYMA_16G046800v4 [Glycine max]|eukprot:XP_003548840.1 uncharacterized protein LOC100804614 [Glycine max]
MSLWNSPSSTSRVQSPQNTPIIPASCSPKLVKRMQQETCYKCDQRGHWSYYCPYKSPKTKPISPSPKQDSTVSYKRAHGSCGYGVTEDELLNGNSNSIARLKQSRQRTLHDFWDGCQSQNDGSQEQIKRMRITDCSENPNIEGASATQNAANVKRDGFSELESAADDIEFMNSVSWETIEAEAILSLSRRSTPSRIPSRIRWRQIMFQKRIFSDDSFEIDKSKENSLTMDEQNNLFEENKMRFAQLQDEYVKTEASLEASNQHKQLLCEQVSDLKTMLDEKQNQLKCCELETLKIETRLGDLKRRMLETHFTLKERVEQTEEARKQSEERQAKLQ